MLSLKAKEWIVLAIACLAAFMDGLDGSIAMIALPTITTDYGVGIDISTWVLISYLFIICAFILPIGKVIERHGVKLIFILGFAIFTITSLLCALAPSIWILIAARFAQGFGACMLAAAAPALVSLRLPSSICGYAFGMISAASAIAFALGPAIGGILIEFLSWHWIFLINIPVGIAAVIVAWIYITPDKEKAPKTSMDYGGVFFIAITVSLLLLCVNGWSVYAPWISATLAVLTLVMAYITLKWEKSRKDPIIPQALIYDQHIIKVLTALLAGVAVFTGFVFLLPFYMEIILDMSPATAGLYLFIPAFLSAILSPLAGRQMDKRGGRIVTSTGAFITIITSALMFAVGIIDATFLFIFSLVIFGIAMGIFLGSASGRVISLSQKKWYALVSAFVSMCVFLGESLGTALFSGILSFYYDITSGSSIEFLEGWAAVCIISLIVSIIAWYGEWIVPDKVEA